MWCSICKLTQTGYEDIQIIIPWSSSQGLYCYISLNVIYFGLSQNFCQYRFYNVLNWTFLRRWKYRNIVKNDLIYSKNIWILCEKSFFPITPNMSHLEKQGNNQTKISEKHLNSDFSEDINIVFHITVWQWLVLSYTSSR